MCFFVSSSENSTKENQDCRTRRSAETKEHPGKRHHGKAGSSGDDGSTDGHNKRHRSVSSLLHSFSLSLSFLLSFSLHTFIYNTRLYMVQVHVWFDNIKVTSAIYFLRLSRFKIILQKNQTYQVSTSTCQLVQMCY